MANNKNIKINLDYSEFSGGIKECQSKMSLLNEQFKLQEARLGSDADEVDRLSLAQSTLTQKIELQKQVVDQSLSKWESMANSEESTVAQTEKAHKAYLKQATVLEELKNELDETSEKISSLGSAESQVVQDTEEASSGFSNFINAINGITAVTSALGNVASVISNTARASADAADDIETMATKFGVSAQTMDQWVAVQELTDVSAQTLGSSLSKLTREMGEVGNGSKEAEAKFKELGIKVTDTSENLRSAEDVFYEVVDALGAIDNPAQRDAAAMELLGKSAQDLNPIIQMGSNAFRELAESSEGVIPDELSNRLGGLSNSFAEFDNAMQIGQNTLVGALAPALRLVLDSVSNMSPGMLAMVSGVRMAFEVFSSLAPVITMVNTGLAAHTANSMAHAGAMSADVGATNAETASELALGEAALFADAAMLPQIATIMAIIGVIAMLVYAIKELVDAWNEYVDALDAVDNKNNSVSQSLGRTKSSGSAASSATAHYATGSTVGGAGGLAWVGEQGPELVNLPSGSTVYNNEQSSSMIRSTNVFNVTIDAKNVNDFNKVVNVFNGLGQSMNRGGLVNG